MIEKKASSKSKPFDDSQANWYQTQILDLPEDERRKEREKGVIAKCVRRSRSLILLGSNYRVMPKRQRPPSLDRIMRTRAKNSLDLLQVEETQD